MNNLVYLSTLKKYDFYQDVTLIIFLILLCLTCFFAIYFSISLYSIKKYKKVIFPEYEPVIDSNSFSSKQKESREKSKGTKVKRKNRIKNSFLSFISKYNLDKKINNLYIRAGYYNKTVENFLTDIFKYFFLGIMFAIIIFFFLKNIFFAIIFGLFFVIFPYLNLYGDIKERENQFRRSFPYFLQTLSFVLKNGSNMSVAFKEVTEKQEEGILKEVMLDVITTQKVNGGDFATAFSSIIDKIQIDETKEFVEIVYNSIEKGIPVAEIFANQSETISRFINNKRRKRIKAVSTKILVPILISLASMILLFNIL